MKTKRFHYQFGENIKSSGKHNLLKLGLSKFSANRYYTTTLSSGNGTRKERKRPAISPIAGKESHKPIYEKDTIILKTRDASISPTTSRNAGDTTAQSGRPGVFDSLRNLEKRNGRFLQIMHIIADIDMLKFSYDQIKSKAGNLTPGGSGETLDGINEE